MYNHLSQYIHLYIRINAYIAQVYESLIRMSIPNIRVVDFACTKCVMFLTFMIFQYYNKYDDYGGNIIQSDTNSDEK